MARPYERTCRRADGEKQRGYTEAYSTRCQRRCRICTLSSHDQAAITVVMKAVQHLNPGQTAVVAFDQPLYALAKEIQWMKLDTMGEETLVVMLGGLHIELVALKAIGFLLLGSGWTGTVAQARITTTVRAESLATLAHITRTRYAHQVTASSSHILQHRAYKKYSKAVEDVPPFPEWCSHQDSRSCSSNSEYDPQV